MKSFDQMKASLLGRRRSPGRRNFEGGSEVGAVREANRRRARVCEDMGDGPDADF